MYTLPFEGLWVNKVFKCFWKKSVMLTKAVYWIKNTEKKYCNIVKCHYIFSFNTC